MRPERRWRLKWPLVWTVVVVGLLTWGYHGHLERYITPQRGVGYWFGIAGGSMMILLLIYSARKRVAWLHWMGSVPAWFQIHMTLGCMGPILVLFHANFHLGATNSNVALVSMLLVASSGVIGRYIYTRLHARMDDHQDTYDQLKAVNSRLAAQTSSIQFLPGLLEAIKQLEERYIEPPSHSALRVPHLFTGAIRLSLAKWRVLTQIDRAIRHASKEHPALMAGHSRRFGESVYRYAVRRFEARRRMTEFQLYSQLFSFWHVLHLPLFFMLLIAGIVHVVAVNVY